LILPIVTTLVVYNTTILITVVKCFKAQVSVRKVQICVTYYSWTKRFIDLTRKWQKYLKYFCNNSVCLWLWANNSSHVKLFRLNWPIIVLMSPFKKTLLKVHLRWRNVRRGRMQKRKRSFLLVWTAPRHSAQRHSA